MRLSPEVETILENAIYVIWIGLVMGHFENGNIEFGGPLLKHLEREYENWDKNVWLLKCSQGPELWLQFDWRIPRQSTALQINTFSNINGKAFKIITSKLSSASANTHRWLHEFSKIVQSVCLLFEKNWCDVKTFCLLVFVFK